MSISQTLLEIRDEVKLLRLELNGEMERPGIKTRLDRLEQRDEHRTRTVSTIAAGIGSVVGAVFSWILGQIRVGS